MNFEYEDIPFESLSDWIEWVRGKLYIASQHDPLVATTRNLWISRYGKDKNPYTQIDFFMLLSYYALKMNRKHQELLIEQAQRAVNPPIILQYKDELLPKELKDKLEEMRDTRSWWKKLFKREG